MAPDKSVERSIDTLQRIYAVVAALAMNEALKRAFLDPATGQFRFSWSYLPEFVAFVATVVPFVHGMNRHLDTVLTKSRKEKRPRLLGYVLVDFFVFLVESSLLFVLAVLVPAGLPFFQWLLLLLTIDVIWALVTWQVTKSAVVPWAIVNAVTILVGLVLIYLPWVDCGAAKPWMLMSLAIMRTAADYKSAWAFYFPPEETASGRP
jgi:hypothetical protein